MSRAGTVRSTLAAAVLAVVIACGGSSSTPTQVGTATNRAFTGALSSGDVLVVDVGTPPGALGVAAAGPAGSVTVSGVIALAAGGTVELTGYYVPASGALVITGGLYELTGAFAGGQLSGTFTINGTLAGAFFAADSTSATVTTYCGTFSGTNNLDQGAFVLLVSGSQAFATVETSSDATLRGSASAGHVALTMTGASMDGAYTTSTATGTWTHGADVGIWAASTAACPVPPAPVTPPSACTLDLDALGATTVAATKSTATMPAVTGGTIPSGTYVLTAVTYYEELAAGPDSFEERGVIVVNGNTFGLARVSNSPSALRLSGTFTTSGGTLSIASNTCAGMGPPSAAVPYVMVGGEVWIQGSTKRLDKFALVP